MIHRSYFSMIFILLTSLIAVTIWLDKITQPISGTDNFDFFHEPDYIIENISGFRVEHDKSVHRFFHARKLLHYTNQDLTQLEDIQFVNTDPKNPPLEVFANNAKIMNSGEEIFLTGDVTAIRGLNTDERKITLKTDKLHLIPDENLVKTDKVVKITRLNTTIQAVGLELNNDTGMVELLSHVRAINQNP
ncbi:MAG: LPS export ABC transporter periplasmic protein LptC [Nitrosomonas sp.]|nr:LPS export ABC transporter periplasmic protein LptC [Nitrosomonas sp.]